MQLAASKRPLTHFEDRRALFQERALALTVVVAGGALGDQAGTRLGIARVVCGGVECVPRRLVAVESTVKGEDATADLAELAGSAASRGARPLNYNHFKVPLMENLVKRAIRAA